MIDIQKAGIIEDEKMQKKVLEVIADREGYYDALFASSAGAPKITVRFERLRPFSLRITFLPPRGKPVMIDTEGYKDPDVVTKHAFRKLRRTAKNYFDKVKRIQRRER